MAFWTMPSPGLMRGPKAGPLRIEDVFATALYTGNGGAQTIANGIDIAGGGGLLWIKKRLNASTSNSSHWLADTKRGNSQFLRSDMSSQSAGAGGILSFASNGFLLTTNDTNFNFSGAGYCSWTFGLSPGFFDVVTYTGNGTSGRQIAHALGVVPGMIIVKRLDTSTNWIVAHRGNVGRLTNLNLPNADYSGTDVQLGNATHFTVGSQTVVNASGGQYVAYLFAHDPSPEGVVQCGSFAGNGASSRNIDLGWPAQYILFKALSFSDNWRIYDAVRGLNPSATPVLYADLQNAEGSSPQMGSYGNGFTVANSYLNQAGQSYAYLAIRAPS